MWLSFARRASRSRTRSTSVVTCLRSPAFSAPKAMMRSSSVMPLCYTHSARPPEQSPRTKAELCQQLFQSERRAMPGQNVVANDSSLACYNPSHDAATPPRCSLPRIIGIQEHSVGRRNQQPGLMPAQSRNSFWSTRLPVQHAAEGAERIPAVHWAAGSKWSKQCSLRS